MIWFRSFCAGLLAVIISVPLALFILGLILKARSGVSAISIDIVSLSRAFIPRLFVLLVFALGAIWEYRRLYRLSR